MFLIRYSYLYHAYECITFNVFNLYMIGSMNVALPLNDLAPYDYRSNNCKLHLKCNLYSVCMNNTIICLLFRGN